MNPRLLLLCLCAVIGAALAGCGGGASGNGSSGISGIAQLTTNGGPVFVGQTAAPRPLSNAVITVQPQGGGPEITRALTGPSGEFRIALLPGTYRVVPFISAADQRNGTSAQSQDVTVTAGVFTNIIVQYTLNLP